MSTKRDPVIAVLKYFEEAPLPLAEQALSLARASVSKRRPTRTQARPHPVAKKAVGSAD